MKVLSLPKALFTFIFSWTIANTLLTASSEINPLFVANLRGKFSLIEEEIKNPLEQLQEKLKNKMFSPVEFEKKKNELFSDSFKKSWTTYKEEINKDNEPNKLSLLFENFESLVKSTPQNLSSYIDTVPLAKLITLFHFCSFLKLKKPWSKKLVNAFVEKVATLIAKDPGSFFETEDGKILTKFLANFKKPKYPHYFFIKNQDDFGAIALSPSAPLLALGLRCRIELFDVEKMQWLNSLSCEGRITSLLFSNDGSKLLSNADNKVTKVWDTKTWQCLATLEHPMWPISSIEFSPKGDKFAAYGEQENTVGIFDLTTRKHTNLPNVSHVRFREDGKLVVVDQPPSGKELRICILDSEKKAIIKETTYNSTESPFQLNHDGTKVFVNYSVVDVDTGEVSFSVKTSDVGEAYFSPDGTKVLTRKNKVIKVWDINSKTCLFSLHHNDWVAETHFNKDGSKLITKTIFDLSLWDLQSGKCITSFKDDSLHGFKGLTCDNSYFITRAYNNMVQGSSLNRKLLTLSDNIFTRFLHILGKPYGSPEAKLFPHYLISPTMKKSFNS